MPDYSLVENGCRPQFPSLYSTLHLRILFPVILCLIFRAYNRLVALSFQKITKPNLTLRRTLYDKITVKHYKEPYIYVVCAINLNAILRYG